MTLELDQTRGQRINVTPIDDASLINYEELYEELFSRMEQSIGAQIRPVNKNKDNGGDG